ncbi:MAG: hypothetical protein LBD95_07580 [Clostridiales Family XIII bacterium]|nr:hypothetical protein [Clostridiales Family XIII bacterium]
MDNYELIYAGAGDAGFDQMPLYRKLPRPVGYVKSADVFPEGAKITVRTLEGDIDAVTGGDVYLMIGIEGEVYPILREKFLNNYIVSEEAYRQETEYTPAILNRVTGERTEIAPFARRCVPKDRKLVRARVLERDTKVFSYWDAERYFCGGKGDYLVANEGDYGDCYIIRRDIFMESYEAVAPGGVLG